MDSITLKNFRCFREEQTVPLAPLTLLVGENSTGKTSFMAMIRALWDVAYKFQAPDFKEAPYDLGSFDEIAHYRGGRGGRSDTFEAGFETARKKSKSIAAKESAAEKFYRFSVTFGKTGTAPVPIRRRLALGDVWIEVHRESEQTNVVSLGTTNGYWGRRMSTGVGRLASLYDLRAPLLYPLWEVALTRNDQGEQVDFMPLAGSPEFASEDRQNLEKLNDFNVLIKFPIERPFASAPVRSKPRRTYDPIPATPDYEGNFVPMYLADEYFRNKTTWEQLKKQLEEFGKSAGLFDEISIKTLGSRDSDPFQAQVRKSGGKRKGPWRNLIDVGYGVSQALPLIIELWRGDAPRIFLLQQPEVHLHPSAQAALGSLFCRVASSRRRQLIVETHSDYLMDRVRMEVRDGGSGLKPEDVSLLYFERGELDVRIHSLRFDEQGNVLGAPPSYRRFFMEETERSLWKRS